MVLTGVFAVGIQKVSGRYLFTKSGDVFVKVLLQVPLVGEIDGGGATSLETSGIVFWE